MKQQEPFLDSLTATSTICKQVKEDRKNHILAIETSRRQKIFDSKTEYITTVIETQGAAEYEEFIHSMKKEILGHVNVPSLDIQHEKQKAKHLYLDQQNIGCEGIINSFPTAQLSTLNANEAKKCYASTKRASQYIQGIIRNLQ
mmetsp:Transcript_19587/g.27961  ORF Transcript_19587/g.27961 Transcript_19587/m.27961 type:complete len:144 (+) Transcript_19587:408-839(+)